jgi:hypothetical protein
LLIKSTRLSPIPFLTDPSVDPMIMFIMIKFK